MTQPGARRFAPLILVLVLAIAGIIYLWTVSGPQDGPLNLSGTISALEVTIASELTGRVAQVMVVEGQAVAESDTLFLLDDTLLQAQRQRVLAAVDLARATLDAARVGAEAAEVNYELALRAARQQQLPARAGAWTEAPPWQLTLPAWYFEQGELMARASREVEAARQALDAARSDLGSSLSEAQRVDLGQAEDDLGEAAAAYEVAREVYDRASLARVTEDLLEAADEQLERARSALEDAQQAYDDLFADETAGEVLAARAGLALAQARYDAARDRLSRLESGDYALQVRAADIARRQAQAGVAQAEASVAQAESELAALEVQLARLVVRAPTTGVVLTHDLQAGEVIVAGGAVMTLGRLDDLTLTVYAPEDRYGQIRLGDRAVVTVDSFPGVEFTAMVTRIADQAEFTPRNVQTEEGRRTTVFAVELALDDSGGRLKPGMPADVRFEGTP